jgi:pilus assembly protein CpaF
MTSWQTLATTLSAANKEAAVASAVTRLQVQDIELDVIRDRERLQRLALQALLGVLSQMSLSVSETERSQMVNLVVARMGGLGFINELLPPARDDLTEIALNPDGSVWVIRKGEPNFTPTGIRPSLEEAWRAVEALLAPIGRSISEASPRVDAKLIRIPKKAGGAVSEGHAIGAMGGARINIVHPNLAPGHGYPSITIRLFEPEPVTPAQIVAWEMAPQAVINDLVEAVRNEYRILIIGGTASGKTTFLSAICSGIPKRARVVKIEDPEEIWLDHPHVVTLEARPVTMGSTVAPFMIKDGVDNAMRMAPRWLIVGEVLTGPAAMALFRAQMSDHPGLSTFHAQSPKDAVTRMAVIMRTDIQVDPETTALVFANAIDIVVQVGWQNGKRRLLRVSEVEGTRLEDGRSQVQFRNLYQYGDAGLKAPAPRGRARI